MNKNNAQDLSIVVAAFTVDKKNILKLAYFTNECSVFEILWHKYFPHLYLAILKKWRKREQQTQSYEQN